MVCPSDEILRNLLENADRETSSTEVISHLLNCPGCQERVSAWEGQARLNAILRAADNSNVDYAIGNLSDVTPASAEAVTQVYSTPVRHIGQYELLRSIGQGGGGEVFEARHTLLRRRVAVKVMSSRHSGNEIARQRFFREMESIGQLNDPHIVHAYDAGEVDGTLYLAMELVDGENVESLARRVGPLPIAEACEIIRQAALGLQHVHESGLVHRDLKPSNLLMSKAGVKVADLGLALLNREEPLDDRLTGEHTVLGTADYMAPEQAEGSRQVDIRADIYSLGCTLFRLLSGRPPYALPELNTPMKKLWAHASMPVPDILPLRPEVPAALAAILIKLMAKQKEDRFTEPREVVEALTPFCYAVDYPSLIVPGGIAGVVGRASTIRDLTRPQSSGAASSVRSLPTEVLPPAPSRRPIMPVLVMIVGCALVALGWRGLFNGGVTPHPATNSSAHLPNAESGLVPVASGATAAETPQTVVADEATKLLWQNEFQMLPTDLAWRGRSGAGSFRLDEDLRALVVHANRSLRLIKLGSLSDEPIGRVQLGMDVNMLSDIGSFGMFLGFRETAIDQSNVVEFQTIEVLWLEKADSKRKTLVRRCLSQINRESGLISGSRNDHVSHFIPEHLEKLRLEIELQDGLLASVMLAGRPCEVLCTKSLNSQYDMSDYRGSFGVFARGATVEFSNPTYQRAR